MSGISSIASSSSTTIYSPLDTNKDGIVDADELQAATKAGLLPASTSSDDDSSDPSAADKFSSNLVSMILQQMQQSGTTTGSSDTASTDSCGSDGSSDSTSIDALFKGLDANGDGEVSSDEFVAGRPKDMSETDAETLFKTLDTENTGMLNEDQLSESVNDLNSLGTSTTPEATSTATSSNPLEAFLAEMQAAMTAYQNTYGQYDQSSATDSAAA